MPQQTMLDNVASDLAVWIDQTATRIAAAMAPQGVAPFSAQISESEKLEYYRSALFNPDGTPNLQGRNQEMQRLGPEGFTQVYKAVLKAYPQLRIPTPPGMGGGPITQTPGAPPPSPVPMPFLPRGAQTAPAPNITPIVPMASGGIVTKPTLALIGEAGPEAVVPLSQYQHPSVGESLSRIGQGASEQYPGMLEPGNIDLNNRPVVQNADGTYSTVRSISVTDDDGSEVLIPTVSDDGRIMSNQEAVAQYFNSGRHLGRFVNPDTATSYALRLHQAQSQQYGR